MIISDIGKNELEKGNKLIPEIFPLESKMTSSLLTEYIGELRLYDALKNFVKSSKETWHLIYSNNLIKAWLAGLTDDKKLLFFFNEEKIDIDFMGY